MERELYFITMEILFNLRVNTSSFETIKNEEYSATVNLKKILVMILTRKLLCRENMG